MNIETRYYKSKDYDNDVHFFREDEIHEAIDNLDDCFFPITVYLATKHEYMDDVYGEGKWTKEEWDNE